MIQGLLRKQLTSILVAVCATITPNSAVSDESEAQTPQTLTPYSVEYTSEYRIGWFSFDIDATRTLEQRSDNLWRVDFDAEASIASLRETSDFIYKDNQIIPVNYSYRASGMIDEPDRTLHFVADAESIEDLEKDRKRDDHWQEGIQDNLTYMLQASIEVAKGNTEFTLPVFEKSKTKPFRFRVVGKEEIKIKAGTFDAIKIEQVRDSKKREVYAWLADTPGYPLIRLRDKKDGKLRYQIQATKVHYPQHQAELSDNSAQ